MFTVNYLKPVSCHPELIVFEQKPKAAEKMETHSIN